MVTGKALVFANLPCFVPRLSAQDTYKYLGMPPVAFATMLSFEASMKA